VTVPVSASVPVKVTVTVTMTVPVSVSVSVSVSAPVSVSVPVPVSVTAFVGAPGATRTLTFQEGEWSRNHSTVRAMASWWGVKRKSGKAARNLLPSNAWGWVNR